MQRRKHIFVWLISWFFLFGCTAKVDNRKEMVKLDSLSIVSELYADTTGLMSDPVCRDIPWESRFPPKSFPCIRSLIIIRFQPKR